MRRLTYTRPKVMLPIATKPILEHLLVEAVQAGVREFIFIVGYHDEQVRSYFGQGDKWGISISYHNQRKQLGTADALRMVEHLVDGNFLMINGDIIVRREDISKLAQSKSTTMSVIEVEDARDLGTIEVKGNQVVKGRSFTRLRYAGDPVALASFYYREGADELVFLDITATPEGRDTLAEVVERISGEVFMPLTVGGGLRNTSDMRRMLLAGADKVSINTAAVLNPRLIREGADKFGSQCIVVAIDAQRIVGSKPTRWEVYTCSGQESTGIDALEWARQAAALGAGEILLTSMDEDGQQNGYDLELTKAISEAVNVPVIASGGAGYLWHLYDALTIGKADAVLAASIFHYGTFSIRQVKSYLAERGLPIRE